MTDDILKLIEYRFSQAEETVTAAKELLANGHYKDSVNRSYYAMFYCALGLLASRTLGSSKHSGVIALFNRHFVKPGLISVDMGKFYSRMFDNRLESDYADWVEVEKQDIQEELVHAEEFVNAIIALIKKQ